MSAFTPYRTFIARSLPSILALFLMALFLALGACSSGGGGGGGSSGSSSTTTTTSTFSAPDCSSGSTSSDIDSAVPTWISDNFTCIHAYVSGSNIVIETQSRPPYTSAYWTSSSSQHISTMPSTKDTSGTSYAHTKNPNTISSSTITMTVPSNATSTLTDYTDLSPTYTESSASFGGIAVDGVAIFNAFAASPDQLADEAWTLDTNDGHPTSSGQYHYHTEPWRLTDLDGQTSVGHTAGTPVNPDALIGIALDGLPIYGAYDQAGRGSCTTSACLPTLSDSDHDLTDVDHAAANFHCHATDEFPSGVCHYHVLTTYSENTTKTIGTVSSGTGSPIRYIIKYFAKPSVKGTYQLASAGGPALKGNAVATLLATAAWCGPGGSPQP